MRGTDEADTCRGPMHEGKRMVVGYELIQLGRGVSGGVDPVRQTTIGNVFVSC